MEIAPKLGAAPSVIPSAVKKVQSPPSELPGAHSAKAALPGGSEPTAGDVERKRYEAVLKASQQLANEYVVSDKTFAIFKDATGQYITRFTNLRDGKVTYVPEPNLVRQLEQQSRAAVRALAIEA